jgi:hypothetical protein
LGGWALRLDALEMRAEMWFAAGLLLGVLIGHVLTFLDRLAAAAVVIGSSQRASHRRRMRNCAACWALEGRADATEARWQARRPR